MRYKRKKLGLAFKDEVLKVTHPHGHFGQAKKIRDEKWTDVLIPNYESQPLHSGLSGWRVVALACLALLIFFGLFLRLFHLQVVQGEENRQLADSNRVQIRVIHAARGVIYDRNGKVLAENNPGFRLKDHFLNREEALLLEAKNDPVFDELEIDAIRYYPLGEVVSHIIGYVGQISTEELKESRYTGYRIGDRVGRSGIEQVYEDVLRGKDGAEVIEIDASGRKLRSLHKIEPIPGRNLYLGIESDLQKTTFNALKTGVVKAKVCCGAAVIENPVTGEILALASLPSYNNNAFTDPSKNEEVAGYFNDENAPLLNRVISGTYPPGSTFKITSALSGLVSGKITARTIVEDTGVISIGPYQFANWYFTQYGSKEGPVDLVKALQRSNDIYFYRVGEWVGEKGLGEVAKKIGMGKKLGIDLAGEVDGLIPDPAWKQKNTGQIWYPGDDLHMAIGQGFLLATPLQISAQTAFVAADGNLIQPHLVTKITYPNGITLKQFNFQPLVKNIFKKENLDLVKKGLSLVPKEGGTAWPFFTFTIPTAGKTGTAEFGDPKGLTHAWYTSYAPEDDPQIVVTVLVEKGGEGSSVAAPIVKEIYNWYFNPDKTNIKSLDFAPLATESAKRLGE